MSKLRRTSLCLALALTLLAAAPTSIGTADSTRYLNDIKILAAPNMEGRGPGTSGLARASRIIEHRYKALGLQPAGTNGYLQPFTVTTGAKLKSDNSLVIVDSSTKQPLAINQDFEPISFSSSGSFTGPMVFVGYGASADEFQYDDYAGVDVKDKIVVLLRYEPETFSAKTGHQGLTQHSQLVTKAINARNHGAKAVILVNGKLAERRRGFADALRRRQRSGRCRHHAVAGEESVADSWFKAAGKSLAEVQQQINNSGKPALVRISRRRCNSRLPSTSSRRTPGLTTCSPICPARANEYIIIGAHYDHLGRGDSNSLAPSQIGQIHPGADDNASGTAGVLELARLFAPLKGQLDRGILFMNFSGEELGLLGSAYWVKNPTMPLDHCVAMINMDMIGRIRDNKVFIGGVGTGSTFVADSGGGAEENGFQDRVLARRLLGQRSHLLRREQNSRAVLLLRPARRLSQALRHLGQDQRALGRAAAQHGCRRDVAASRRRRSRRSSSSSPKRSRWAASPAAEATARISVRFPTSAK